MTIMSRAVLAAAIIAFATWPVQATPIADWKVLFSAGPTPINSGENTNSPQFGDDTAGQMDGIGVAGLFGPNGSPESVMLSVGQTLTVTANVTLTGGVQGSNSAYRFAVQNDGGQFAANDPDNWAGGWMHTLGLSNGSNSALYGTNTGGNYMSTSNVSGNNSVNLGAGNSTSGTFSADTATPYTWTMSITRDSATTVDIVSSFIGGPSSFSQTMTASDVTTSNFTYTAVGIQTTGQSDLDQLTLSNVQFAVVPEPSTGIALLGGLGAAAWLCRRRARLRGPSATSPHEWTNLANEPEHQARHAMPPRTTVLPLTTTRP